MVTIKELRENGNHNTSLLMIQLGECKAENERLREALEKCKTIRILTKEDVKQESQEELWEEMAAYINWKYEELNIDELKQHFKIERI
jgi:hypothetical protein